jgi:hypothetical protein
MKGEIRLDDGIIEAEDLSDAEAEAIPVSVSLIL